MSTGNPCKTQITVLSANGLASRPFYLLTSFLPQSGLISAPEGEARLGCRAALGRGWGLFVDRQTLHRNHRAGGRAGEVQVEQVESPGRSGCRGQRPGCPRVYQGVGTKAPLLPCLGWSPRTPPLPGTYLGKERSKFGMGKGSSGASFRRSHHPQAFGI